MLLPRLKPILTLAAIGLGMLCGCQPAATIKVGFIGGLSGRVSELAIDGRNGAQLAIETLNAQPGPRYELRLHDDSSEGRAPAAIVDAMADEGDAFAIGPMTSVQAKAMVPQAGRRQLVLAGKLLSAHPRLVLLVCGSVDASIIAQQLRRRDPDVQIAMASWAANVQPLQIGGRAIEGALVLQALDLDSPEPAYVAFRKRYVERFGSPPSQAAVFSYDATMLGAEALHRKAAGQSLREALRAPASWPGLQRPIVLDHFGDSVSRFRPSEVRQGRFVMVGS